MKVTITFDTTDDEGHELEASAYSLSDFFYGADDGQVSIGNLKIKKTESDWRPPDE